MYLKNNLHCYIFEQIKTAFATKPNIAATIHGQRKIFQGCYGRRTALFPKQKMLVAPLPQKVVLS